MTKFFKKRWHGLSVGLLAGILSVCLVAGSVFAAYNFLTVTAEIEVREPMVVSIWDYNNQGDGWQEVNGTTPITDWGVAGDSGTYRLKIENRANNPITVTTQLVGDDSSYFTLDGLPDGEIGAETTWEEDVVITIDADASPRKYTFDIVFDRS